MMRSAKILVVLEAAQAGLAAAAAGIALALLTGCSTLAAEKAAAEAEYAGQQLACVDKAKTIDESRECRRKVREKWGIAEVQTSKDGGQ
jgi:uncharacterized membrane protein